MVALRIDASADENATLYAFVCSVLVIDQMCIFWIGFKTFLFSLVFVGFYWHKKTHKFSVIFIRFYFIFNFISFHLFSTIYFVSFFFLFVCGNNCGENTCKMRFILLIKNAIAWCCVAIAYAGMASWLLHGLSLNWLA